MRVLIGRPFLDAIGLNLENHLKKVYTRIHDSHFDLIDLKGVTIASKNYKGLS